MRVTNFLTSTPEVSRASYPAVVAVASPARPLRPRLHSRRLPLLRRLDQRPGGERRGTHHHPVPPRPGTARPLEAAGELRRGRPLEPGDGRVGAGRPAGRG